MRTAAPSIFGAGCQNSKFFEGESAIFKIFLASLFGAAFSCSHHRGDSKIKSETESVSDITSSACQSGLDSVIFGLQDPAGTIRLTVCSDYAEQAYVNQFVLRRAGLQDLIYTRDQVTRQEKLKEALFSDPSGLHIELGRGSETVKISGNSSGMWEFAVTGTQVIIGIPLYTDPFGPCAMSQTGNDYKTKDLILGTARLKLHLCSGGFGTSGTYSYSIVGVDISDSNSLLLVPVDTQLIGVELGSKMTEKTFHHNICNSLVLRLPSVIYGIAMHAGNGPSNCALADAPDAPTGSDLNALYRATYGSIITEGSLNITEYFR